MKSEKRHDGAFYVDTVGVWVCDDTVPAEVELQQGQIELLQQQNACCKTNDQLEQTLTNQTDGSTLMSPIDWTL